MRLATRRDLLLIAGLILCAIAGFVIAAKGIRQEGALVRVLSGGEERSFLLSSKGSHSIEGRGGVLMMEIDDSGVRVVSADCPDHLCVGAGPVSYKGEVIVCLPLGIVITVEGEGEYDAVAW